MRKNLLLIPGLFSLFLLGSCTPESDPKVEAVKRALDVARSQLELSASEFDSLPGFPRSLMPKFKVVDPKDWTSGFYPGTLWEAYRLTGDAHYRDFAEFLNRNVKQANDIDGSCGYRYIGLVNEGGSFSEQQYTGRYHWLPWCSFVEVDPVSRLYDEFGTYEVPVD